MKSIGKALIIFTFIALVVGYCIYAIVVFNGSKSPNKLSEFPSSGEYVCQTDDYILTIDLDDLGEGSETIRDMKITLETKGKKQMLETSERSGHGTILVPTSPCEILIFTSKAYEPGDAEYVKISFNRFVFEEDDIYLKNLQVGKGTTLNLFKNGQTLHFTKKVN